MQTVKGKNGERIRKVCVGCKYNDFKTWKKADKDYCFLCKNGSEKIITNELSGERSESV